MKTDTKERRSAAGALAMSAQEGAFFRQVFDGLGFALITLDRSTNITFFNQAAEKQFGRPADALIGRSFLEILRGEDREKVGRSLEKALQTSASVETEVKLTAEGGELLTLVLIFSPILDDAGRCVGASAAMRDISKRKRLSQELARSRRMAALGRMAGGVAHHFNNILGGMLTSIDYVLASDSPRELRKTLRLLAQAIGRATRITNQLAAFAESENEVVESMALNQIISRLLERIRPQARRVNVEILAELESLASEPLEAQRLLPALESLAQNAFDAMPEGGTLTISLRREGDQAVIGVRDTGCGIPPDLMDRLFEPFFTTKGELGGGERGNIGLGLAVVHGLVAELGGTIEIRSWVGTGTEAVVHLPLTRTPGPGGDQVGR